MALRPPGPRAFAWSSWLLRGPPAGRPSGLAIVATHAVTARATSPTDRRRARAGARRRWPSAGPAWRGVAPAGSVLEVGWSCTLHDGAFRARLAVQPGRGGAGGQDPRGQGAITPLSPERAPSRGAALPRVARERHGDVRARARGPKRATSDKALPYRSDPLRSGERKWRNPARGLPPPPSFRCCRSCRPRAGRDVHGPTCPRGSARGDQRRGSWPARKAP